MRPLSLSLCRNRRTSRSTVYSIDYGPYRILWLWVLSDSSSFVPGFGPAKEPRHRARAKGTEPSSDLNRSAESLECEEEVGLQYFQNFQNKLPTCQALWFSICGLRIQA